MALRFPWQGSGQARLSFVAGILLLAPGLWLVQDATADASGRLQTVRWRAQVLGSEIRGAACWIMAADGALRLEITRFPGEIPPDSWLQNLLEQKGEGWTLTSIGSGRATWNAWGEAWHDAQPLLENTARVLLQALQQGPGMRPDDLAGAGKIQASRRTAGPRPRWAPPTVLRPVGIQVEISAGGQGTAAHQDAAASTPGGRSAFRSDLESRGRGRGGRQEVLRLSWPSKLPEAVLIATSSRRAGRLQLKLSAAHPIQYPELEGFLPLWPLAELLTMTPEARPR